MARSLSLVEANGWKGLYYYVLFPLDMFRPEGEDQYAYQQFKLDELLPVFGWLLPLLVFAAITATSLNFIGLLFLFGLQAAILALITKFHLKLAWNQATEVFLNAWASMVLFQIVFAVLAFGLGVLTNPDIEFDTDD